MSSIWLPGFPATKHPGVRGNTEDRCWSNSKSNSASTPCVRAPDGNIARNLLTRDTDDSLPKTWPTTSTELTIDALAMKETIKSAGMLGQVRKIRNNVPKDTPCLSKLLFCLTAAKPAAALSHEIFNLVPPVCSKFAMSSPRTAALQAPHFSPQNLRAVAI